MFVVLDSSVGIATCYGIESQWEARFSAPVHTDPGSHLASYTIDTGSFPGVKRPGRDVDHPPAPRAEFKCVELLPLWAFVACSKVKFTFTFMYSCYCTIA